MTPGFKLSIIRYKHGFGMFAINAPVALTSEASLPDLVGETGTSEVIAATIVCSSGSWDDADAREVAVDLDSLGRYGSKQWHGTAS